MVFSAYKLNQIIINDVKYVEIRACGWYNLIGLLCVIKERCIMLENDEKWINIDEVAEYIGVKVGTVRSWLRKKDRDVPAHKIGKQWKFKKSELDLWIKSGKSAM